MIYAFPPCIYLCSSGLHWNKRIPNRVIKTDEAYDFFMKFAKADCPRIVIENPIGCMSTRFRKPDQIIQPHYFGDDASKATCLWLKGVQPIELPPKDEWVKPRIVDGKKRWANQTDSGQNKLGPSAERSMLRSKTYPGISRVLANLSVIKQGELEL